jgi:Zn-ribbon RNA-binding protein
MSKLKKDKLYKACLEIINMKCISCNKENAEGVVMPCPRCGEKILRCSKCRSLSIEYKCKKCEFEGP